MNYSYFTEAMIEESYDLCEKIMKDRATNFYQAFKHLPKERFQGVVALYAFCRYADDMVDNFSINQQKGDIFEMLHLLESRLQKMYSADAGNAFVFSKDNPYDKEHPWWLAFEDTIHRFNIPINSFLHQIEGQRMDADFKDIQSMEEFIRYCRLVAGSVGTMMLPLLANDDADITNPGFIQACENLGVGMQITNILRDVGEDLRIRNRVYLPADMLTSFKVARTDLESLARSSEGAQIEDLIPDEFIQLWEKLAYIADTYYHEYKSWITSFHPSCQMPLTVAALSYHAIADAVRAESYNCFTKRCYTSVHTRTTIINKVIIDLAEQL